MAFVKEEGEVYEPDTAHNKASQRYSRAGNRAKQFSPSILEILPRGWAFHKICKKNLGDPNQKVCL